MKKKSTPLIYTLPFVLVTPVFHGNIYAQNIEKETAQLSAEIIEASATKNIETDKFNQKKSMATERKISKKQLKESRMTQLNEALRTLTGVQVRDEEGASLRPNIGIRGLNPGRTSKVTLVEDELPVSFAPYGDNASYYHPPLSRFDEVELITGAEQLKYGPQTIGGTIKYKTIDNPASRIRFEAGNRGYQHLQAALGTNHTDGLSFQLDHQKTDGNRNNQKLETLDLLLKKRFKLSDSHTITATASLFKENSQIPYTGLTEAEYNNFGGEYNPFKNDRFETKRRGLSLVSDLQINDNAKLKTAIYDQTFDRSWFRSASTTTDTQCGSAYTNRRLAGGIVNQDTCNSRQIRTRNYHTQGIDSRLTYDLPNLNSQLETGLKLHRESQKRKQFNTTNPLGQTGTLSENNIRKTDVVAGFLSYKMNFNNWKVNPIIRYERIAGERENRLNPNIILGSEKTINAFNSGLNIAYQSKPEQEFFGSIHQGYAPPRTEDLLTNNGGFTLIQPEKSVNVELGLKQKLAQGNYQFTVFHQDFSSLTSGGLAQGKALFQGIEQSFTTKLHEQLELQLGYTYLPTAEQTTPFTRVDNNVIASNSKAGNRQPYASKHVLHVGFNIKSLDEKHRLQTDLFYQSKQFSDFGNFTTFAANGQQGVIAGYFLTNMTYNWQVNKGIDAYISTKNMFDKKYIVDRSRGIMAGMGRSVFAGVEYKF